MWLYITMALSLKDKRIVKQRQKPWKKIHKSGSIKMWNFYMINYTIKFERQDKPGEDIYNKYNKMNIAEFIKGIYKLVRNTEQNQ